MLYNLRYHKDILFPFSPTLFYLKRSLQTEEKIYLFSYILHIKIQNSPRNRLRLLYSRKKKIEPIFSSLCYFPIVNDSRAVAIYIGKGIKKNAEWYANFRNLAPLLREARKRERPQYVTAE